MNCREAQSQLFAERDGALATTQRVALDSHLAQCGDCQRARENLSAALTTWRTAVSLARVPDVEREWHAVRRQIRGGAEAGAGRNPRSRRSLFTWLAVPLGAAAAVALALFVSPQIFPTVPSGAQSTAHVVGANSVDIASHTATTVVFVDDKSGWLFVWASDPTPKQG
jgi:hypothetical protein